MRPRPGERRSLLAALPGPRQAAWVLLVALLGLAFAVEPLAAAQEARLVFFVRHAEKAKDDPKDPTLSEAGKHRAKALAKLLSPAGVTHLFSNQYRRTRQTLEPLAEETGIEVQVIPAGDPEAQEKALRALPPGSVAVVVGHSNTVPALVESIGGAMQHVKDTEDGRMFEEDDYHRMFLVILPPGMPAVKVQTLELRYGD